MLVGEVLGSSGESWEALGGSWGVLGGLGHNIASKKSPDALWCRSLSPILKGNKSPKAFRILDFSFGELGSSKSGLSF